MAIVESEKVFDREGDLVGNENACSLGRDCEPCSGNVSECAFTRKYNVVDALTQGTYKRLNCGNRL